MKPATTCLLVLITLLSAQAHTRTDTDAVNERIPVSRYEMEEHWQVDCAATWRELADLEASNTGAETGQFLTRLQLCSFIYQPPGSEYSNCPNYRLAEASLRDEDWPQLRQLLSDASHCLSVE
jgi:hypothetical protein